MYNYHPTYVPGWWPVLCSRAKLSVFTILVQNCQGAKLSDAKLSGAKLSYHVFSSSSILQSIYKEFGSPYNKARFACFVLHSRLFENSIFVFEQIL